MESLLQYALSSVVSIVGVLISIIFFDIKKQLERSSENFNIQINTAVKSINDLNINVAKLFERIEAHEEKFNHTDLRLSNQDKKIQELEKKKRR